MSTPASPSLLKPCPDELSGLDDWTLVIVEKAHAGEDTFQPDLSKAIDLNSSTETGLAEAYHLPVDLGGGRGATDGKLVLRVAFGSRAVSAAFDM